MHQYTRLQITWALSVLLALLASLTSTPPAAGAPLDAGIMISGVQEGDTVTGVVVIQARVSGIAIRWVKFALNGPTRRDWYEGHQPYIFGGDTRGTPNVWDTTSVPNGNYTLTVTAKERTGSRFKARVRFRIANQTPSTPTVLPAPTVSPTSTVSLTPTPSPASTATPAPLPVPPTCHGRNVRPGTDLHHALRQAGPGATLCFQPGIYRLTAALRPKQNQTLQGLPGAVLNGAILITNWQRSGTLWVAYDALPTSTPTLRGICMPNYTGCRYPHDVSFDHTPLERVMEQQAVTPGTFYTDYATNAIYIADNPANHHVEVSRTAAAIVSQASGVTLRGLTVEKFASAAQDGAIFISGTDSLIEHNEVRLNHAVGIKTLGTRITVRANRIHHNGQLGLSGVRLVQGLVEDNELAYNNTARFWNFDFENGGGKWTRSQVTVRNNHAHHNAGVGLWFDIDCRDVVVEDNRVADNESDGIRFEISYHGVIRGNLISGNAHVIGKQRNNTSLWMGGGIVVNTSAHVEITNNTLDDNLNGIELRKGNRGWGMYGERDLRDVNVHHNTIGMPRGTTGLLQQGDGAVYTSKQNQFHHNTYYLAAEHQFVWQGKSITPREWRAYGNDREGIFHEHARPTRETLAVAAVSEPPALLDQSEHPSALSPQSERSVSASYQTYTPLVFGRAQP